MVLENQSDKLYGRDIAYMSGRAAEIEAALSCLSEAPFDSNWLGRFRQDQETVIFYVWVPYDIKVK